MGVQRTNLFEQESVSSTPTRRASSDRRASSLRLNVFDYRITIDSTDNVHDVCYDVHECENSDTEHHPEASWPDEPALTLRVNHCLAGRGRVLSLGSESQSSSLFNAYDIVIY